MTFLAWIIFVAAAVLEVGGDALVRKGLVGHRWLFIAAGFISLSGYGLVVNLVRWDFSRLMGVYVAVFALLGVLTGRVLFHEEISVSTWLGLGLIVVGGLVIQLGTKSL